MHAGPTHACGLAPSSRSWESISMRTPPPALEVRKMACSGEMRSSASEGRCGEAPHCSSSSNIFLSPCRMLRGVEEGWGVGDESGWTGVRVGASVRGRVGAA